MQHAMVLQHTIAPDSKTWTNRTAVHLDLIVFSGLLVLLNLHLLGIPVIPLQVFSPRAVSDGKWWRIVAHPLVHVSWYHLFLDAGAFMFLYTGLDDRRMGRRLCWVGLCAGASLAAATVFVPELDALGLCGLSGTAHGLMALSGLEMMRKKEGGVCGVLSFWLVTAKSIYEMISGDVVFEFMHLGMCGTTLAPCHLGGVAGGILAFMLGRLLKRRRLMP